MKTTGHNTALAETDDTVVGDDVNQGTAWYSPEPKEATATITGRIAFWKGVEVA